MNPSPNPSLGRRRGLRPAGDGLHTALVTGACSGIGLSMARLLADLGYHLILVSERAAALEAVAAELRGRASIEVTPIALDLARPEAAAELHAAVRARGLAVDLLINNAGFFFFGEAVDADPARAAALLQLHVVTPSLLCTHFGAEMRARGRGHILMVSSLSAWNDFPGIAYYGSSKRYLLGFGRALRSELRVWGVWVTCLAPGATATGLYAGTRVDLDRARRARVMMEADAVAEAGLRAMFSRRALCVPGVGGKVMTAAAWLAPRWLIDLARARGPWMRGAGRAP